MGSTDNAAASTKLPRHSRESGNPAGQSKGLGTRVRGDDGMEKPTTPTPSGLSSSVSIGGANAPGDVF
jgi:hypothetical protein|tara:strand:- start:25 stop:228 length:204 start_codon:yes stop_codon:yes gene_type:complete